jgi:predicted phage tail protein
VLPTNIFQGGTYYCQVQWTVAGTGVVSFRDGGFILGSKNVSVTGGAPSAPTTLTATAISGSQINLTWVDASSNETGFQVERSLTSGSDFTLITTTAANATSFSNTGLNAGTQYFYRVRSVNAGGNSAYTAEANATTTVAPSGSANNVNGNGYLELTD